MSAVFASTGVLAHHSSSMFDMNKDLELAGTIKEMQWTNPHGWLQLVTTDAAGVTTLWSIETAPPSMLERFRIKRSDFKTGERVTVHTHPIKDGQPIGLFMSLTRPDGSIVKPKAD
jgi:hypothetical protein